MASAIEDYALIGDCETAALVSRNGSIDWLCWPRFDSGACFAALLGGPEHGRWLIAPTDPRARMSRHYRDDTLILETEIETPDGAATIIDFMPLRGETSDVVRIVVGRRGRVDMRCEIILRFDYGVFVPWVTNTDGTLKAIAGPDMTVLRTPVELRGENMTTVGEFTVTAGDKIPFVLSYGPSHRDPPEPLDAIAALSDTEVFWHNWSAACTEMGEWSQLVRRSLITLKALIYRPTGGIVAAPTTSLPEQLGGVRNWDYRYCWLRDATFTLLTLMHGGIYGEAEDWRQWLLRAIAGDPAQIQIMYGIAGERRLIELELKWLPGYQGAAPVRIGNAASGQLQLDIYGEVMDALYHARRGGLAPLESSASLQRALLEHLAKIWRNPDEGMWEVRGSPQHFTHSKIMAWVAFDRAIKSAEQFELPGPVDRWKALRQEIHDDVCAKAFNAKRGAFVQYYGADTLDASVLMMPLVGFLPITDPRVISTVEAIERDLMVDGFVLRYDTERGPDGLPPGEGAFLACSFWLADCLVMLGRIEDARQLFARLCLLCNDVGLLAEEYDPRAQRLVGNFPQAFSHIALVNTAHNLTLARKAAHERPSHVPGARTCSLRGEAPEVHRVMPVDCRLHQ
jgi:GH15 family glucan-1,4-alpha-glucosidase